MFRSYALNSKKRGGPFRSTHSGTWLGSFPSAILLEPGGTVFIFACEVEQHACASTSRKGKECGRARSESTVAGCCYSFSPLNIAKCGRIRSGNELLAAGPKWRRKDVRDSQTSCLAEGGCNNWDDREFPPCDRNKEVIMKETATELWILKGK